MGLTPKSLYWIHGWLPSCACISLTGVGQVSLKVVPGLASLLLRETDRQKTHRVREVGLGVSAFEGRQRRGAPGVPQPVSDQVELCMQLHSAGGVTRDRDHKQPP